MPTKMGEYCRGQPVVVRVYVEGPRRRRLTSTNNHLHLYHHHVYHHHFHHQINNQEVYSQSNRDVTSGYDRRAQLLLYSRQLRESTRSAEASPSSLLPPATYQYSHHNSSTNNAAIKRKPKHSKKSTCLWNCKLPDSNCLKSFTTLRAKTGKKKRQTGFTSNAMTAAMKSLQVQKKREFFSKLFPKLGKQR